MIKSADGSNKFLMGLKGGGMPKYDCRIGKLFAESDDPIINRLGKYSLGFCTPCTIQQEVCSCRLLCDLISVDINCGFVCAISYGNVID